MTDIRGSTGGLPHQTERRYFDQGDGTHAEGTASLLYEWSTSDLDWIKVTGSHSGFINVSDANSGTSVVVTSGSVTVTSGSVTVTNASFGLTGGNVGASISNAPSVTVTSGSIIVSNAPSVTVTSGSIIVSSGTVVVSGGTVGASISSGSIVVTSGSITVTNSGFNVSNAPSVTVTSGSIVVSSGSVAVTSGSISGGSIAVTSGSISTTQGQGTVGTPWITNMVSMGGTAVAAQTKGTQATNFIPVQDALDTGRTKIHLFIDQVGAISTEALVSLSGTKGTASLTASTAYTVTSGKTLRIQAIAGAVVTNTTTALEARFRVRENAASTVTSVSNSIANLTVGTPAAVATVTGAEDRTFPDGLEVAGGNTIGVSELSSATTGSVSFSLVGFEY